MDGLVKWTAYKSERSGNRKMHRLEDKNWANEQRSMDQNRSDDRARTEKFEIFRTRLGPKTG